MLRCLVFCALFILPVLSYAQQDVDLHVKERYLQGKNVLKVKRDFHDVYLWVLAENNEVYRINSITGVIDNMSGAFVAYAGGHKFVDIAGVDGDQVFVATNSTDLLQYKSVSVNVIGNAQGVNGIINSIAVRPNDPFFAFQALLYIATDKALIAYDRTNEKIASFSSFFTARIFESNYRSLMHTNLGTCGCIENGVEPTLVSSYTDGASYNGSIWAKGAFGNELKTAYFSRSTHFVNSNGQGDQMKQFWATEKGLFQKDFYYPSTNLTYSNYLKDKDITKISSIYGLLRFYSPQTAKAAKENLLIGTKNGLYFSNSKYQDVSGKYSFSYCSELGNKVINDINVNTGKVDPIANNYVPIACEDGIWVAANDGLYLLRPDYAPFIDKNEILQAIQFEGRPGLAEFVGCGSLRAVVSITDPSLFIQWYKDGVPLTNENKRALTISASGDYYAIVTDPCANVSRETNHLKADINSPPTYTFDYPDRMEFCAGATATLSVKDRPLYVYRWFKDGQLDNNRTNVMNTDRPGKYRLELTNCTGAWVSTKEVEIAFVKVPMPFIKPDKAAYCSGEQAVLTADIREVSPDIINWQPYQYKWYKDGVLLPGTSQSINVSQTGKYKVEATACAGNSSMSDELQINFVRMAVPTISASKAAFCIGDQATLSVPFVNDGTYTINWLRDGIPLTAERNKLSITTTLAGSYRVNIASNIGSCSQASAAFVLNFETPPTIIINRVDNTTLCSGQSVDLKATYSGGSVRWNTGETTDQISIKNAGTYTATVSTVAGCNASNDFSVQFLAAPTLNVPNATLCQYSNEKVTLTAPAGFAKYEWNGKAGAAQYVTGTVGSVTLKVTDNNGCTATQTISIASKCKDIHIPNTFTPNGDGINDKWLITGLETDPSVSVKIYTRGGALLYTSQGYATPWDGVYKGSPVHAGVYYYVIAARGAQQMLSGSITVVR